MFEYAIREGKAHVPYSSIGKESICSDEMKALSVDMANDTIVLLKNDKQILPLNKNAVKKILVVGPNAIYRELGGYSAGSMSKVVDTPVNVIAGTDATNASEEHDRDTLELPYGQSEKIQKLLEVNENTIVVLQTLGAVGGAFFDKAHTILNEHFAGQEQGTAIANVIFGKVNPNAKLTATWYKDVDELPMLNDYGIRKHDTVNFKTRTYMYYKGEPIFPFGHGLSYTTFDYSNMKLSATELDANDVLKAGETKTVELTVPVSDINFWSYLRKKLIVESGTYRVEIGRSSADIVCCQEVTISGDWDAPLANVYAVSDKQVLELCGTAKIKTVATLLDSARLDLTEHRPVYTSSDNEIIRVDEHGRVTAAGRGAALVTVSVGYEGETKSARIGFAVK